MRRQDIKKNRELDGAGRLDMYCSGHCSRRLFSARSGGLLWRELVTEPCDCASGSCTRCGTLPVAVTMQKLFEAIIGLKLV